MLGNTVFGDLHSLTDFRIGKSRCHHLKSLQFTFGKRGTDSCTMPDCRPSCRNRDCNTQHALGIVIKFEMRALNDQCQYLFRAAGSCGAS